MVILHRWVVIVPFFLFVIGCSDVPDIKGKIFCQTNLNSIVYVIFNNDNTFAEYITTEEKIKKITGRYTVGKNITIFNFFIYDELKTVLQSETIGSLEVYYKNKCIFFHYDYPEFRFCQIKQLPIYLK